MIFFGYQQSYDESYLYAKLPKVFETWKYVCDTTFVTFFSFWETRMWETKNGDYFLKELAKTEKEKLQTTNKCRKNYEESRKNSEEKTWRNTKELRATKM